MIYGALLESVQFVNMTVLWNEGDEMRVTALYRT